MQLRFGRGNRSRFSSEGNLKEPVADDEKRWLQPLDVAFPLLLVGRRSRVSGEGGTEEGVWSGRTLRAEPADDGKRVSAKTVASILCLSVAIRGLVRKGETERIGARR